MASKSPPDELAADVVGAYQALDVTARRQRNAVEVFDANRVVHWSEACGNVTLIFLGALCMAELFLGASFGPLHMVLMVVKIVKSYPA